MTVKYTNEHEWIQLEDHETAVATDAQVELGGSAKPKTFRHHFGGKQGIVEAASQTVPFQPGEMAAMGDAEAGEYGSHRFSLMRREIRSAADYAFPSN